MNYGQNAIATVTIALFFGLSATAQGQEYPQWGPLKAGPHAVGFRSVIARDASRSNRAPSREGASTAQGLSRPIQISVWYPARLAQPAQRLPFFHYYFLVDRERSLAEWSDEELQILLQQRVDQALRAGVDEGTARNHYTTRTAAVRDAPPAKGPFPLLVFSPSMLGSPLSNTVMCEYLASHGYIVAAHPSFGPAPSLMTTQRDDLDQQVRDIEFVIGHMQDHDPAVDAGRTGVVGHSWGGLAGLLAAARNRKIRAVASLDGSEEMWKDLLDQSPEFDPALFTVPYLRLHKPRAATDPDNGLFDSVRYAPTYRIVLDPSVAHFEFVSNRVLTHQLRGAAELQEKQQVLAVVSEAVLRFFEAHARGSREALEFFDKAAARSISAQVVAVERRPGLPAPPSDEEFLALIWERGWDAAKAVYQQSVGEDPQSFCERRMLRLGEQLLWTGRKNDEALALLGLAAERFPLSARAQEMIGNVYFWNLGEPTKALPHYQKAHRLDPNNLQLKTYLEQLQELLKPSP